jgi:hypothetical protein
MNHLRIAKYDVLKGTSKEVAEVATGPGGILDIYRSMPGFQAYSLLEIDAITVMGITAWETHESNKTFDLDAIFITNTLCNSKHLFLIGITHNLNKSMVIA